MMTGRQKGKVGAEALARELTAHGIQARRNGTYRAPVPDVELDGLPVFVKSRYTEALRLFPSFEACEREAGDLLPVLAHRRDGKPWLAVLRMDHLAELLRARVA